MAEFFFCSLEGTGPETVSQHRAAVVLSWFGNDLEGRRLRRPRYQGEDRSLLGVGEALREAQAPPPGVWTFVGGPIRGELCSALAAALQVHNGLGFKA